jgi:hypothetical protein
LVFSETKQRIQIFCNTVFNDTTTHLAKRLGISARNSAKISIMLINRENGVKKRKAGKSEREGNEKGKWVITLIKIQSSFSINVKR